MQTVTVPEDINHILEGNPMLQSIDIDKILSLKSLGWGSKRISKELGVARHTIKKYIKQGGQITTVKTRSKKLDGLENWLKSRYKQHQGNADVIRQELLNEHQCKVSLRTVERAVEYLREEDVAKAKATVRFETPPGKQLQIDFGSTKIHIAGEWTRVFVFVATLGYSRRLYIAPFLHERQNVWFSGLEGAFLHFGGTTQEVLVDNAKSLVQSHDIASRAVVFNDRFKAFAQYWGIQPVACAPYRARTKGKDERMVGYVKRNAIAGREFPHWEALVNHLHNWNAEVADVRIHGTIEEKPIDRFLKEEKQALRPLTLKPPFIQIREIERIVHTDSCIELDANYYSVPNRLIGKKVSVQVVDTQVRIYHHNAEVACHLILEGRRKRAIEATHLKGIVGALPVSTKNHQEIIQETKPSALQRSLEEYNALVGGGW